MPAVHSKVKRKREPLVYVPPVLHEPPVRYGKCIPPSIRTWFADLVHGYCQEGTVERQLADKNCAHLIQWDKFKKSTFDSPIAAADAWLCKEWDQSGWWKDRPRTDRAEILRNWFIRLRTGDPQFRERRAQDKPRIAEVGAQLNEQDWDFCHECLVNKRYRDEHGRFRRFASLEDCYDHKHDMWETNRDSDARRHVEKLQSIKKRSAARSWAALNAKVMARYNLHYETEKFHEERERNKHQVHAQRFLSQRPVLEYHRSRQKDPRSVKSSYHC